MLVSARQVVIGVTVIRARDSDVFEICRPLRAVSVASRKMQLTCTSCAFENVLGI